MDLQPSPGCVARSDTNEALGQVRLTFGQTKYRVRLTFGQMYPPKMRHRATLTFGQMRCGVRLTFG